MPKVTMRIAREVAAGAEDCTTEYIPAAGEEVVIAAFVGESIYAQTSNSRIVWDAGGAGETIIWSIKGSGRMPFRHKIYPADTDGVKKLAICLENGESSPVFMAGYAKLEIEAP